MRITLGLLLICSVLSLCRGHHGGHHSHHSGEHGGHHSHSSEEHMTFQCDRNYNGRHDVTDLVVNAIKSPNFPEPYPQEEAFECTYVIENTAGGRVRLIFDDFMLSCRDTVTITDVDGWRWFRKEYTFKGNDRPFSIVSTGTSLRVVFKSRRHSRQATGFKATYHFVENKMWFDKPETIQSIQAHPSNTFTATNPCYRPKYIDYVWILRGFEDMNLLVGIEELSVRVGVELQIRDGPTSEGALLEEIHNDHYMSKSNTVYVRLRTRMQHKDTMIGTFVSSKESDEAGNCADDMFRCKHGRCIMSSVVCDGYNHCGDNSDEDTCDEVPRTPNPEFDCDKCHDTNSHECYLGRCFCLDGYYGDYCDHKEDEVHNCDQCLNDAQCSHRLDDEDTFVCVCQPGYYGTFCDEYEERDCECRNGGTCSAEGECLCHDGYYGSKCQIAEEPDDSICGGCENGGRCQNGGYCLCYHPYYGSHCENDQNECSVWCWYGGICEHGYCSCQYGYYGDHCQYGPDYPYEEPVSSIRYTSRGWFIGVMVTGCVVILALLVATGCCIKRLFRSDPKKKSRIIKPYSVSANIKYTAKLPLPNDESHSNPTYECTKDDNVSLPPSYDDIGVYSNNPDVTAPTKERDVELNQTKGNEDKYVVRDNYID